MRLYDWELRMRKVCRSFFPEEGVVKDMDTHAENVGVTANHGSRSSWSKRTRAQNPEMYTMGSCGL